LAAQASKASRRDQTQTTPRTTNYGADPSVYQTPPGLTVDVGNGSSGASPAMGAGTGGANTGLTPLASQLHLGGDREFSSPNVRQLYNGAQQVQETGINGSEVALAYGAGACASQPQVPPLLQQQQHALPPMFQQQQQYDSPQSLQQQTTFISYAKQSTAMSYMSGPLGAGIASLQGINPAPVAAAPDNSSCSPWNPTWPYGAANQQQQQYTHINPSKHSQRQSTSVSRPGHVTTRCTQPAALQPDRPEASWPYLPGYAVVESTAAQQQQPVVQTLPPVQQVAHRRSEPRQQQQQQPQPTHSYSLRSAAKAAAAAATKAASAVVTSTTTSLTHKTLKDPPTSPAATSPVTPDPQQNQAQAEEGTPPCRRGMNPATVLRSLGHVLTPYEKSEVLGYPEIWFVGRISTPKIRGSVHSGLPNAGYDDNRGEYQATPGDHIAYRYEIVSLLGQGSFGQVLKCVDHGTGSAVALKIIRNKRRFQRQAQVEATILSTLKKSDPADQAGIVRIYDSFTFRSHLCITFELLSANLYEDIKANNFIGMPLPSVRHIAYQVLNTLVYLRGFNIVHCDLKPENILLNGSNTTSARHEGGRHSDDSNNTNSPIGSCPVKVIDFGSSCYADQRVFTYIQSRFYRAPEVILGLAYGHPIDVWSLACVLAELVTGTPLFPGEHEAEQMACICEILGLPPPSLLRDSPRAKLFFDLQTGAALPSKPNSQGKIHRVGSQTLSGALNGRGDALFVDFLKGCLQWDPERRMTAQQALQHPWIGGMRNNNGLGSGLSPEEQQYRLGPLGGAVAALGFWR
jgi:dual specificity tyrosine-phosphorylation-regulated kinase 2/3/4